MTIFFFFSGAAPKAHGSSYTTATATQDPSRVCDLYHSLRQRQILNPLSKTRDRTRNLMDTSQVLNLLSHKGTPKIHFLLKITKLESH